MPVVNTLTAEQCALAAGQRDLGPIVAIASERCTEGVAPPDIFFLGSDQRNGATLITSGQYIEIPNQSSTTNRRESRREMRLDLSLGAKILDIDTTALTYGRDVVVDALDDDLRYVPIKSAVGRVPKHYQVAILPVVDGTTVDFSLGWMIHNAIIMSENDQKQFSIDQPIESTLTFMAEAFTPLGEELGRYYNNLNSKASPDLTAAATQYVTAYPQS